MDFTEENVAPTDEQERRHQFEKMAWKQGGCRGPQPRPPFARPVRTFGGPGLAEIPDAEIWSLGEQDRRGLILEWQRGRHKRSPVKVNLVTTWTGVLPEEFDWLPAAERILNGGHSIRIPGEAANPNILRMSMRKQA
jgi:hypothetical protein